MRGISPIVAVVLLIAITVIASVGVWYWIGTFTGKKATPNVPSAISANLISDDTVLIANLGSTPLNTSKLKVSKGSLICPNEELQPGGQVACKLIAPPGDVAIYGDNTATVVVQHPKGWSYREKITIQNAGSSGLTDYQVEIDLNASNVGSHFDWAHAGIRFTWVNSSTGKEQVIPYWIQEWNATAKEAVVWIKVPSIPANGNAEVYIYYGNSDDVVSNGDSVFEFFDDFNENSLDTSKWTIVDADGVGGTSFTLSNGKLVITAGGNDVWSSYDQYGSVGHNISGNFVTETKITHQDNTHSWAKAGIMVRNDITKVGSSTGYIIVGITPSNGWIVQYDSNDNGYLDTSTKVGSGITTTPSLVKLIKSGYTFIGYYKTDSNWIKIGNTTLSSAQLAQDIGLFVTSHAGSTLCGVDFDWIFVRKYNEQEPIISITTEEAL